MIKAVQKYFACKSAILDSGFWKPLLKGKNIESLVQKVTVRN